MRRGILGILFGLPVLWATVKWLAKGRPKEFGVVNVDRVYTDGSLDYGHWLGFGVGGPDADGVLRRTAYVVPKVMAKRLCKEMLEKVERASR